MSKSYIELLKDPRWQRKRLLILERDGWRCRNFGCGDSTTTLHVHHRRYTGKPWEAPDEDLVTLCEPCHERTTQLVSSARRLIEDLDTPSLEIAIGYLRGIGMCQMPEWGKQEIHGVTQEESIGVAAVFRVPEDWVARAVASRGGTVTIFELHEMQERRRAPEAS